MSNYIEAWHGTPGGYTNHKCKCDECRSAWNNYCKEAKRRRKETSFSTLTHGVPSTYYAGCRCELCAEARRVYQRGKYQSKNSPYPEKSETCDCCGKKANLVFDHDHATLKFRGWLCHSCNTGIGKLGDDLDGLQKAVDYLRKATR